MLRQLIIFGITAIVVFAIVYGRKFSVNRLVRTAPRVPDSPEDSAIISYYSAGHMVAGAQRSELNGMKYSTYVTLPSPEATYVDDIAAILALDLPYNTQTHVLGLSKQHKLDRIQFANFLRANGMEKVELEGDFPDYFDIYAAADQDVQVRQILNPESMQFVVDFCRSHFWEINSSELYLVATQADQGNDNIITESQQFVDQIKPALLPGEAGAAVVHHAVPYGEYDGPPLPCPICQKIMVQTDNWFVCPDGHGVLINGADIIRLRDHKLKLTATIDKTVEHGLIICPNCHNRMTLVDYQDSGIKIDSCEHCPYRWLDANEVDQLGSKA